jgi:hypothetical protein
MRDFRSCAACSLVIVTACAGSGAAQQPKPVLERKNIAIVPVKLAPIQVDGKTMTVTAHQLLYHRIAYGLQLESAENGAKSEGNPSRLATTYYHRESPIGIALQRFNWFPGPPITYAADARLPASLIAQGLPLRCSRRCRPSS